MTIRWEEQERASWWAYSGEHIIGMVVPVALGPHAGEIRWQISCVTASRHQTATSGLCSTVFMAKRSLRRAWSIWLRERGLAEVS